jgi:hypothetical protein
LPSKEEGIMSRKKQSQYVLIFFSVTSKYSVDEPIIYKLSEFKKTQVMKNKHVLLKIKKTKYCSVCCHGLELSNFMRRHTDMCYSVETFVVSWL